MQEPQQTWLQPEEVTAANSGGKAGELARMKRMGVRVPDFLTLSQEAAARIRKREKRAFLPEELAELRHLLQERLPDTRLFAVRSSANHEDGEGASFAGLLETYLNVSKENLPGKILACLDSLEQAHIQAYADHHRLEGDELEMGVIIQEMVPAEKSGVLFTVNPKGLLNESVVVVGSGLGEGVVQELVPVTTYYLKRDEELQYFEREEDSPLLKPDELADLLRQTDLLEEQVGERLDIEFSIAQERVYLLQVRPITNLGKPGERVPQAFNNSNLVESYPGLTLPLTESFIQFAYEQVFRGVAWRFSRSQALLDAYDPAFRQMLQAINGRMYYHMNHLYSLLQFLPFPKLVLPIWQEMMGMHQGGMVIQPELKKQTGLWESLRISLRILKEFHAAPHHMELLNDSFQSIEATFRGCFHKEMSQREVKELYGKLASKVLANWDVTLVNDLYAFVYTGILQRLLKRWGDEEDLLHWNKWFSGIPAITSMEPVHALQALAKRVQEEGSQEELAAIQTPEELSVFLAADETGFSEQFEEYIDCYGDRSLEELKLETETFRTNPLKALEQLLLMVKKSQQDYLRESSETADELWEESLSFKGIKRQTIRFLSRRARLGIQHRETSRLNRSRIYGMVRALLLRVGEIAVERGQLDQKKEIFFLTLSEVDALNQPGIGRDWRKLVRSRRQDYAGYAKLPAYGYLLFQDQPFSKSVRNAETVRRERGTEELRGIPTSSGVVEGEILVVEDPKQADNVEGKILVTRMTDPGWVFLLTRASGVIAEKGSLLSHTAIISRELGIPAIVNVHQATTLLESGIRVRMDGNSGKIMVMDGEGEYPWK